MKNKNSFVKLGLMGLALGCFGLSFTSAASLKLDIDKGGVMDAIWLKSMTPIHFADNGNDFGGLFYFSNGSGDADELEDPVEVTINGGETFVCKEKVKGFYYNAERGERLWPLDDETKALWGMNDLTMNGGLYTRCSEKGYEEALEECKVKAESNQQGNDYNTCIDGAKARFKSDEYGYYGNLYQEYKGQKLTLIAGVDYDSSVADNKFIKISVNNIENQLSPTFIRFGNKYPVGFVYDYNGGIGFVGCRINPMATQHLDISVKQILRQVAPTGPNKLVETFEYDGTEGIRYALETPDNVDCSQVMGVEDTLVRILVEGLLGMTSERNDFGTVGNLSDDKTQYFFTSNINSSTLLNYAKKKSEILCRGKWSNNIANFSNSDVICLQNSSVDSNTAESVKNAGKTLIVKNGNVSIKPFADKNDTNYHDIFIDSGYLLVEEPGETFVFTTGGFISNTTVSAFAQAVSAAMDAGNPYMGGDSAVGSFLRGNFIVNGYIKGSGLSELSNKYFIYGKFTSKDDYNSLQNTFAWRCTNWNASDGNFCPGSVNGWHNPYANFSLVIIDQNYKSPFFTAS